MGGRDLAHVRLEDLQRLPLVVICSWPSPHGEHGLVFARRRLGDVGRGRLGAASGPSPTALGRMGDEGGRTGRVQVKKLFRS